MGWTILFMTIMLIFQGLALSNQAKVIEHLKDENEKLKKTDEEKTKSKNINLDKQNIICYNCLRK